MMRKRNKRKNKSKNNHRRRVQEFEEIQGLIGRQEFLLVFRSTGVGSRG